MKIREAFLCSCCFAAVCGGFAAAAQGDTKPVYDIWLSNRVQHESDATGSDTDLRQVLSVYGRDLLDGHLDLRLSGAHDFDLDREDTIDDAYSDEWPRLYEAALDLHDYGALSHLVLGRQRLSDVDYLHFDGLSLSLWEGEKVGVFGFGGRPFSYYSSNDGEWLAGAGARFRPLPSTSIQVDGYGIDDGGRETVFASALRVSQYFASGFGDTLEARWLDNDFRDLSVRLHCRQNAAFDISGGVYWQAERLGAADSTRGSRYFSLYSDFMRPAEEQLSFSINGNRYLGDHFTVSAGGGYKYILDREREGGQNTANVDSKRVTLGFSVADLPTPGLDLDLFASYYRHPDEDYCDLNGEIGYAFTPRFRASCGVTYAEYDFAEYLPFRDRFGQRIPDENGGRQTSRLVFLEAQYRPSARWRILGRAELEDVEQLSEDAYAVSLRVDYHLWTSPAEKKAKE